MVGNAASQFAFKADGPLRIIGVGNGDPGSHEADRPVERHSFTPLARWRTLALDAADSPAARAAVAAQADLNPWRDPAQWLPPEQQPPATPYLALRGEFTRADLAARQSALLFIDQLDPAQQVYVNGRRVVAQLVDGSLAVPLAGLALEANNSLSYVLPTPPDGVSGLADRSAGGTRWGSLRVSTAADPWQRKLFNGWAQVIVQSTGAKGTATLSATTPGMAPAVLGFTLE